MAISGSTVWEIRQGGDDTNGGGYVATGTDYTLQDTAQLSLTDLACTTGGVILTSATGGFTAAMIGNLIHINTGTNFVVGFYEIVGHTDTNTITLDRDPTSGGNGSSGEGKVGGALASLGMVGWAWTQTGSDSNTTIANTHTVFVKYSATSYTMDNTVNASGGAIILAANRSCYIIGYDDDRSIECQPINRPYINLNARSVANGYYLQFLGSTYGYCSYCRNLIFDYTVELDTQYILGGGYYIVFFENIKVIGQRSATGTQRGISSRPYYAFANAAFINCEAYGGSRMSYAGYFYNCFFYKVSSYAYYYASQAIDCVAYDCSTGFYNTGLFGFKNCIADNCDAGYVCYTARRVHLIDCVATNITENAFYGTTGSLQMLNCATGNVGTRSSITGKVIDINPILLPDSGPYWVDAANFDFRPTELAKDLLFQGSIPRVPTSNYIQGGTIAATKPILTNMNGGMRG